MIVNDDLTVPLNDSSLRIQCTATEVTATFTYSGDFSRVAAHGVVWICQVRLIIKI